MNTNVTQLHNVRAEPVRGAPIVGQLVADTQVEVLAEAGDWLKVVWHQRVETPGGQPPAASAANGFEGWALRHDANNVFLFEV